MHRALVLLFLFFIPGLVNAQEITHQSRLVASGFNCPWELRWGKDGWIWFTERAGRINRVHPETGEAKRLLVAPEVDQWYEAGMLGFDFHPSFPDSPYVYVAFTYREKNIPKLSLFRYTYRSDSLTDKTFVFGEIRANFMHVGCRVVTRQDKIFMSVGEIDRPDSAQLVHTRHGKILRINRDGSIPSDNPFPNNPVWSYGHRNPQGLVFGRERLYSSEHGASTDDEVNLVQKGLNYGWPLIEGYCNNSMEELRCDSTQLTEPLYGWEGTLGVSGIDFYDHDAIPEWRNSVLVAALKDQTVTQLKLDAFGRRVIHGRRYPLVYPNGDRVGRLRDFCISPEGRVFVSTSKLFDPLDTSDVIVELIKTGVVPQQVTLVTPETNEVLPTNVVTLRWNAVAGDAMYKLQIARKEDFSIESYYLEMTITDTFRVLTQLDSIKDYFWRVREVTSGGEWSEGRRFTVGRSDVAVEPDEQLRVWYDGRSLRVENARQNTPDAELHITNVLGETVLKKTIDVGERSAAVELSLPSGTYYARVIQGRTVTSCRFQSLR